MLHKNIIDLTKRELLHGDYVGKKKMKEQN